MSQRVNGRAAASTGIIGDEEELLPPMSLLACSARAKMCHVQLRTCIRGAAESIVRTQSWFLVSASRHKPESVFPRGVAIGRAKSASLYRMNADISRCLLAASENER